MPTASRITQARKRLGPTVLGEVFEQVAGPVATASTRGAWLWDWRLLAIDGFDVDVPDTEANAAEFGYAGSGDNRSAFPKARVVALAECGTHAFVAAEVDAWSVGRKPWLDGSTSGCAVPPLTADPTARTTHLARQQLHRHAPPLTQTPGSPITPSAVNR